MGESLGPRVVDVVAVEGDVDVAERDVVAGELADEGVEAAGDDRSAGVNADDRERLGGVLFDDLVRDPNQGSAQVITVEYDFFVHAPLLGLTGPG